MSQLPRALAISRKDIESYYGKPPLVTWRLLFPRVLMLSVYVKDPARMIEGFDQVYHLKDGQLNEQS